MANVNIIDLTALTDPATADEVEVYDASASQNKRLALSRLVRGDGSGARVTGAGTIALGGFTLTVPATGTAALRGVANTFTQTQTVDGNLNELLTLRSSSAGFGRLNLGSDVQTLLDFNTYTGSTLRARLQFAETGSRFIVANRTNSGVIEIQTTTAGGVVTEAARITATQHLLVGTTTDNAQLSVDQASSTGALPVLLLDQGDVDQDFIEFTGGSTTGNATSVSTSALGTYQGRIQITVNGTRRWIPFYADA